MANLKLTQDLDDSKSAVQPPRTFYNVMFGYPDKGKWKMFTQIRQKPDDCLLSTGTKRKQAGQNILRMIEVSGLQYFRNCSYSIFVLCF